MNLKALIAATTLAAAAGSLHAQSAVLAPPQNVLQLQASGTVEVQQDMLAMTLSTSREGTEAAAVQAELRKALESALAEAKKTAQPGQMEVRTGNFSLHPRHNRDGRMIGWSGSTELVLEGRDFPRIAQAAGRIQTMTLAGVQFNLSREQRAKVESEAQALAIQRFQAKATELAKGFGFSGYSLREVAVNANDHGFPPPRPYMAREAKAAMADAPVPVEAGKSAVVVTVSGSVQLR